MAESHRTPLLHSPMQTKDSTLSSLRECDRQITASQLLIRKRAREQNYLEQYVKRLEENKASLLALQPKLQENILQLAKSISISDTDCLRIKNKLPYLSRRAIADNISRLELQLRSHNYRPREEELVLKEICKLRNSLPLVEVYRERLQSNRTLRNDKMQFVNRRNGNFERLQKMHATLLTEINRLNEITRSIAESEKGLEDVLKRKDALIEVAKEKLKKRQKKRQQKQMLEKSRSDTQCVVTESPKTLHRSAPLLKRDAFSLELTACRFLLRYSRSLVATTLSGAKAMTAPQAEDSMSTASTRRTVSHGVEDNSVGKENTTVLPLPFVDDEISSEFEHITEDLIRTKNRASVSTCCEEAELADSILLTGDQRGKFYSKHKEQEVSVLTKPKNKGTRFKAKKSIGHPPEIVVNFIELGIPVPRSLGDVPVAISNIQTKLNYFELLNEQVNFENVSAQREAKNPVTCDCNLGTQSDVAKPTRTHDKISSNVPFPNPLTNSNLVLQSDGAYNHQLDFRETDGFDFPAMGGGKDSVSDSNPYPLASDTPFHVSVLDCEDSLQLGLLCPLPTELKSYCEVTKRSLEPVHSLPVLASFNPKDDPCTTSHPCSVSSMFSPQSSVCLSDDVFITSPTSVDTLSWVSESGVSSSNLSCGMISTTAALSTPSHPPASVVIASVCPPCTSAASEDLECPRPNISSGTMKSITDDLGAEPLLNVPTTRHHSSTTAVAAEKALAKERSHAADGIRNGNANIHDRYCWDGSDSVINEIDFSIVKDVMPDKDLQLSELNDIENSENKADIVDNNSSSCIAFSTPISVGPDAVANVGECPESPTNDHESDVESGVCYDEEDATTDAMSLLQTVNIQNTSNSSLDVISEGYRLVSSSNSIASSDSGVAVVSKCHVLECDPTCSTDSSKSTSSGCSCNCNNSNAIDDGCDWSNSDLSGRVQQITSSDGIGSCDGDSRAKKCEELISSFSSELISQPTSKTLCSSSNSGRLQQVLCQSVPGSVPCSVVSNSVLHKTSSSAVWSSHDYLGYETLDQSALPIPTIHVSESNITSIRSVKPPSVGDQLTPFLPIDMFSSSLKDFPKKETVSGYNNSLDKILIGCTVESPLESTEVIQNVIVTYPYKSTCKQPSITHHQSPSSPAHLTFSRLNAQTTSSPNCLGLSSASLSSISSVRECAQVHGPTPSIAIDEQCDHSVQVSASYSLLQGNQCLPVSPVSPSPLDTSPAAGFCALSPAHVSALSGSCQGTALASYADITKSSVPRK